MQVSMRSFQEFIVCLLLFPKEFINTHSLKEQGHYFPKSSRRVRDANKFQLYLFQKVWEIFICCNMLSGSIFYVFFNRKTIGPKKIELGRRGPKFQTIFFGNFHFLTFLMLVNRLRPMEIRPENACKHSNSTLCIILKLLSPRNFFDWSISWAEIHP